MSKERGLFFYAIKSPLSEAVLLSTTVPVLPVKGWSATREIGGGSCARKDNIGMYRLQATQLQHDKRKEVTSGQNGNKEVL